MLGILASSVDILIQFSTIFLCRRYVFLEKGFEGKKQHYYNLASICLLLIFNFVFGDTTAQVLLFFIGGLNIAFARKKHRIRGFFLIIPIAGIINGIIVPILLMSNEIFGFTKNQIRYIAVTYGILIFSGILFYIKGKNWRYQFETQMGDRHLQKWESLLLCMHLVYNHNVIHPLYHMLHPLQSPSIWNI